MNRKNRGPTCALWPGPMVDFPHVASHLPTAILAGIPGCATQWAKAVMWTSAFTNLRCTAFLSCDLYSIQHHVTGAWPWRAPVHRTVHLSGRKMLGTLMCQTPKIWDLFSADCEAGSLATDPRFKSKPHRPRQLAALTGGRDEVTVPRSDVRKEWTALGGNVPLRRC